LIVKYKINYFMILILNIIDINDIITNGLNRNLNSNLSKK